MNSGIDFDKVIHQIGNEDASMRQKHTDCLEILENRVFSLHTNKHDINS